MQVITCIGTKSDGHGFQACRLGVASTRLIPGCVSWGPRSLQIILKSLSPSQVLSFGLIFAYPHNLTREDADFCDQQTSG